MGSVQRRAAFHLLLSLIALSVSPAAQAPARSAALGADAFVGTWILNPSKSTYENLEGPKSGMRTFDYERDGMILCTAYAVSAAGRGSFVHYVVTLDGKEYEEMTRSSATARGARTPTYVSAKKIDDRNITVDFKQDGKVTIAHAWTIAPDGKTFTVRRRGTNQQGQPTLSVMVYDKE